MPESHISFWRNLCGFLLHTVDNVNQAQWNFCRHFYKKKKKNAPFSNLQWLTLRVCFQFSKRRNKWVGTISSHRAALVSWFSHFPPSLSISSSLPPFPPSPSPSPSPHHAFFRSLTTLYPHFLTIATLHFLIPMSDSLGGLRLEIWAAWEALASSNITWQAVMIDTTWGHNPGSVISRNTPGHGRSFPTHHEDQPHLHWKWRLPREGRNLLTFAELVRSKSCSFWQFTRQDADIVPLREDEQRAKGREYFLKGQYGDILRRRWALQK